MTVPHTGLKRSYGQMRDTEPKEQTLTSFTPPDLLTPPKLGSRPASRERGRTSNEAQLQSSITSTRSVTFEPTASIVLIGIRGVGKSTLGVLAATAYNRRLIDSEKVFLETTGSTSKAYRNLHGTDAYQKTHTEVLKHTLATHDEDAVIICSFSDLEKGGSTLIRHYAKSHPVVHISRDAEGVQSHIKVWTVQQVHDVSVASHALLRSCSNFEYYNLSESEISHRSLQTQEDDRSKAAGQEAIASRFLALKRTERNFLRFLRNILGDNTGEPYHRSAYILSTIPVEERDYTFSVTASVSDVIHQNCDLDQIQVGADCVELVVDRPAERPTSKISFNDIQRAFAIVRRASTLPILVTFANTVKHRLDRNALLDLIDLVLRLGPDFCTIDLNLDSSDVVLLQARKRSSKLVGVLELDSRPEEGWGNISCTAAYRKVAESGCDLIKITMPAGTSDDTLDIHAFRKRASALGLQVEPRLIAYSTGLKGRTTRCFNPILTSVRPESHSHASAPSDPERDTVTAQTVTKALFASFVLHPLQFFVFGADVSHSLSPAMHNAAYEACGMQYSCSTLSSDSLEDFESIARGVEFGGSAVAHPFKTIVAGLVDRLSPHAAAIGAVNTVVPIRELKSDGSLPDEPGIVTQRRQQGDVLALYGFNTDWIGIRTCIRRGLSPANTIRPQSSALVCGAGGMARSAVYSLLSLGVRNILVWNRTFSNAVALVSHYKDLLKNKPPAALDLSEPSDLEIQALGAVGSAWPSTTRQPTVIVNCIPRVDNSGMGTEVSLPEAWLKSPTGGVLVEVAYSLPMSPLMQQIKDRASIGWIALDGFEMIPEQAYPQFEIFTGRRAPRKLMKEEMLKHCILEE